MQDSLQIMPYSIGQAPQLALLHQASFKDATWSLKQITESLQLKTTQGLIANLDDIPVGFILFQVTQDEAEILTFCVHPDRQRHKIGEALLSQTIDQVMSQECPELFLEVAADNTAACALYEKMGFRVIGRRPAYYARKDGAVDALTYQLSPFASG